MYYAKRTNLPRYCSPACHHAARLVRPIAVVCTVYGKTFIAPRSDARTCSPACRQKAYRQRNNGLSDEPGPARPVATADLPPGWYPDSGRGTVAERQPLPRRAPALPTGKPTRTGGEPMPSTRFTPARTAIAVCQWAVLDIDEGGGQPEQGAGVAGVMRRSRAVRTGGLEWRQGLPCLAVL